MTYKLAAPVHRRRWALGAVVCVAMAAWCTAASAQGYQVKPWNARAQPPATVVTDLNGTTWRLADLRGKAVLLNFWASWCEPCRAEMPSLQALADRVGPDNLVVLAINYKESPALAAQFAQRTGLTLPVVADPQGAVAQQWGVTIFPSTVLIGSDGRVRAVVRGELDWTGTEAHRLLRPLWTTAAFL